MTRQADSGRGVRLAANAAAFQLGWPVCVLAGSGWAVAVVGCYLVFHFAWVSRIPGEWRAIAAVAAVGIGVDALSLQVGLFHVSGGGFPVWLAALWLLFATTLNHCLAWLRRRWWLSALLGSLGGTGSYVAGISLGAASFGAAPAVTVATWLALWLVLFPALLALSHRLASDPRGAGGMAIGCLAVAMLTALPAVPVHARELVAVGSAYNSDGGKLLYREYHYRDPGDGRATVIYRDDADRDIAEKVLHFGRSPVAPSFEQRDLRNGALLGAQWQDNRLQLLRRDAAGDDLQSRRVRPPGALVIDAGFDNFIRRHFARLVDGKTVTFDFALPARLRTVTLEIDRRPCAHGTPRSRVCFRVSARNWLIRMLASSIDLEYDRGSRRLLTFRGVSNIAAADGGGQHVVIRYRYLQQVARSE